MEFFVQSVCKEIDLFVETYKPGTKIDSVFFGGGTPSLLSAAQLSRIINKLYQHFEIISNAEWTLESNPGSLDLALLSDYKTLGINRLSIGIQSFNDIELKFLQRIHNERQADKAIKDARKAGFENINTDLIFSIPGQDIRSLTKTLNKLLELSPEHVSAYSLIYEKGTPLYEAFKKNEIEKVDDDRDAEFYELISHFMIDNNFEHYEISNYAKRGKKSVHNLNYWNSGDYYAFGPSGHGYMNGTRYWNVSSLPVYQQKIANAKLPRQGSEILTFENKVHEKIMLGLRSTGIYFEEFIKEFDFDIRDIAHKSFNNWHSLNLCELDDNHIRLNYRGYSICSNLVNQLIRGIDLNKLRKNENDKNKPTPTLN